MHMNVKQKPKEEPVRVQARKPWKARLRQNWPFLAMMIIPTAYFILFCYWPMFGISMAFQNYKVGTPFLSGETEWVGLMWLKQLLNSSMFPRLLKNTLLLNIEELIVAFPLSVIFALLLNEIRTKRLRKFTANVSLLPWFISIVVIVAIMNNFFSIDDGIFNNIIEVLGGDRVRILGNPKYFRALYIGSGIWQSCGYGAVVYTAAIAGIDPTLYEAAAIDGSTRLKNIFCITIPCIMPTILICLILRFGSMMASGTGKILLMYSPVTFETADVFGTYAYRAAFNDGKLSYGAAIDLFTSIVNLFLVLVANKISKKVSETSLF